MKNLTPPNVAKRIQIWVISLTILLMSTIWSCDHPYLTYLFETEEIETDTIIPCVEYVEVVLPEFVTGYAIFDLLPTTLVWQGGGISSTDLSEVLDMVYPNNPNRVYNEGNYYACIIDGTNEIKYLPVFARDGNNSKMYMGWSKQGFTFFNALTSLEYDTVIAKYPSVRVFNFYQSTFDSLDYHNKALNILGVCKAGRDRADFRSIPMDTSVINKFIEAGWENVFD